MDLLRLLAVHLVPCRRPYPGRSPGPMLCSGPEPAAFPVQVAGRLLRLTFSRLAQRSHKLRPEDSLSRPKDNPFASKALDYLLPPNRLGLLPGV